VRRKERKMVRTSVGIIVGIIIGLLLTTNHYENKYSKLRSEIIIATGVDISYPYSNDEKRLNNSWFHEK
jgi:hypothetical protein